MKSGDIMTQGYGNKKETLSNNICRNFKLAKGVRSGGAVAKNHTMATGGHIYGQLVSPLLTIS